MWIIFTLITFFCWGVADLFYKLGNKEKYSHLKTGIIVGLVMGIHATIYLIIKNVDINILDILKYLPVSLLYISSMVIGYKGLRYLELSISSPIQNTSGVITSLLLVIFFKEILPITAYIAFILIFIGIFILSLLELKETKKERIEYKKNNTKKKVIFLTILFPLMYCFLDGIGTFLDGIYLDKLELISEDTALIAYEYTFFIYGVITYIYIKIKKESLKITKEKNKILAAIFETVGQFFYVFAMSGNATISASIIGSYAILSLILSRIFLKEKLTENKYIAIFLVIIGIVILSILDL
ncbi:MAG: EamA family transporter [Bacilli bacterium]|nr:EamA family transporter [Bacilli bacterium]